MAKILIVYATHDGQTVKIAGRVAALLAEQGHQAELLEAHEAGERHDFDDCQGAIVAAPVRAGAYPRSIQRFVRQNRPFLEHVPALFLSVSLAVASKTPEARAETEAVVEKFCADTGWRPHRVELVAGALPYTKYNFFIRFIMRRIVAKQGGDTDTSRDYEYTDWARVDRVAAEFASEVRAAPLPP